MNSLKTEETAETVDSASFRQACACFASGVTVTTTCAPDGSPHGLTVSSFASLSLAPPLVLVCVDVKRARLLECFRQHGRFAINILSQGQDALSARFARPGPDSFDELSWYRGVTGVPLLRGTMASLECLLTDSLRAGDHQILIGAVQQVSTSPGSPLVYFNRGYRALERVDGAVRS
jgi:flavin reductase (DIM6/NTAB) family NADH-FMN oxidoreductase RutF